MKHSKATMVYPNKYRTKKNKMKMDQSEYGQTFVTSHLIFKKHLRKIGLISKVNFRVCI